VLVVRKYIRPTPTQYIDGYYSSDVCQIARRNVFLQENRFPDDGEDLTETCWTINDTSNIVITICTLRWSWSYILEFIIVFKKARRWFLSWARWNLSRPSDPLYLDPFASAPMSLLPLVWWLNYVKVILAVKSHIHLTGKNNTLYFVDCWSSYRVWTHTTHAGTHALTHTHTHMHACTYRSITWTCAMTPIMSVYRRYQKGCECVGPDVGVMTGTGKKRAMAIRRRPGNTIHAFLFIKNT
jgi:hypothetical protein